jgi:hypothetical protein
MIEDIVGCGLILLLALLVLRGAVSIATGGFLTIVFGGLVLSFVLQTLVSICSTALLGLMLNVLPDPSRAAFLRGVLAALAQPTVSGIAVLAAILVLSYGAHKVSALVEDAAILLQSHEEILGKDEQGKKKN